MSLPRKPKRSGAAATAKTGLRLNAAAAELLGLCAAETGSTKTQLLNLAVMALARGAHPDVWHRVHSAPHTRAQLREAWKALSVLPSLDKTLIRKRRREAQQMGAREIPESIHNLLSEDD